MVTRRRTQTREPKSIGSRAKGPRNKGSDLYKETGVGKGSSKGLENRQRKKVPESRTEEEIKEKRESQLERDIHQETTGQATRQRKDRKTWDRKQDRRIVRGNKQQGAGQRWRKQHWGRIKRERRKVRRMGNDKKGKEDKPCIVTPLHKKGPKEDPGSYRPISLTLVPGKTMEQFTLSALTSHVKNNQGIRPSQHGFMKGRSCFTNLISFYDQVTRLVDEGKAVDVVRLDFSKAFDAVSHSILPEKLPACCLAG